MLNIRDLKIDPASLGKPLLLVEVRPYSEYKDGKAVEGIAGYRYDVCLAAHRLEKLGVKIEGPQLMESPEDGAVEGRVQRPGSQRLSEAIQGRIRPCDVYRQSGGHQAGQRSPESNLT